jgi:lysyl-tRNA synthetase class 2
MHCADRPGQLTTPPSNTPKRGASIAALRRRASILASVRAFFAERDVLEVETAAIAATATPDPALVSLRAAGSGLDGYLHTSPEYMMKRLLADGSGDIFQLCRVYRDGEVGTWHEPEFTLLEWYRLGYDEHALMREVDALIRRVLGERLSDHDTMTLTYDAVLEHALGLTSDAQTSALTAALIDRGIDVPTGVTHDQVLDLAMATVVAAGFATDTLTFVHEYPVNQAALAEINAGATPRAARFEVFLGAIELGNGFRELTDASEQRARFEKENQARVTAGLDAVPLDEHFLAALESGLPPCAGVAIGFDRLVAAALGATSLAEVVAFTHVR